MDFVVQNRSGRAVSGMTLNVSAGTTTTSYTVPSLAAGETYVAKVPVDEITLKNSGSLTYTTQLTNPTGVVDQVPANNRRSSVLSTRARRGSGIGQPSLRGRRGDGLVEGSRLPPRSRASGRDAVASLADGLVADDDRLIPSVDECVALEARHELVERSAGPSHTVIGDDVADHSPRFIVREDDAEGEELKMR